MTFWDTLAAFPEIPCVFFFLFGACVGSFLNVCVYRIAAGESIVSPPSHCACGRPIKFYNNIPILSWFLLRGRAACCGRRISFRYPLVEGITALVFLGLWILLPAEKACVGMVFAALMIFCAFFDLDTMTLPDFATIGGTAAGVFLSGAFPGVQDVSENLPWLARAFSGAGLSCIGAVVGAGLVYWLRLLGSAIFRREAMGEGDVILAGCIGAFCGWQGAVFCVFGGSVLGALLLLPLILFEKVFPKNGAGTSKRGDGAEKAASCGASSPGGEGSGLADGADSGAGLEIPFGPWLALGGGVYYAFLSGAVDAYFANLAALLF